MYSSTSNNENTNNFGATFSTKDEPPPKRSRVIELDDKENDGPRAAVGQSSSSFQEQPFGFLGGPSSISFPMTNYFASNNDSSSYQQPLYLPQQPSSYMPGSSNSAANVLEISRDSPAEVAADSGFQSDLSINLSPRLSHGGVPASQLFPPSMANFSGLSQSIGNERPKLKREEEFCKTPSRTALLTSKQLSVSVGEIDRRINGPELLNISILGAYLRKAKEKSGGKALRDELKQFGMELASGRRKNGNATTWTCFVEEETQQMVSDLDELSKKYFPVQGVAQTVLRRLPTDDYQNLNIMLEYTRRVLSDLLQVLRDDHSPIHGRENLPCILDKNLQGDLCNYSCVTHGFGVPALISSLNVTQAVVEAMSHENALMASQRANFYGQVDARIPQHHSRPMFATHFNPNAYIPHTGRTVFQPGNSNN